LKDCASNEVSNETKTQSSLGSTDETGLKCRFRKIGTIPEAKF
jgi:hypothetical protein